MGFFDGLFSKPNPEEAEGLLISGRAALWKGEQSAAVKELARAARGTGNRSLALAYLSMARRMGGKFEAAFSEAEAALVADPSCMEGYAARAVALLSLKRLPEACVDYQQVISLHPHDREGHALRLLMVALFIETILNAKEDESGFQLEFLITPATRCAIRTLDGRARLGLDELPPGENTSIAMAIARGAAYYFADFAACRSEWGSAAAALPEGGGTEAIRESLQLMSRPA